jgi:hypothetical protein
MYPFSFLHIIQAANAGIRQDYFTNFNIEDYGDFTYTATAHAQKPNTGIFNYFDDAKYGRTNCTDGAVVFGSTPPDAAQANLWSCALYPNLTRDFRDETLSPEEMTIVIDNDTNTSISTSNQVSTFLSTCLRAWCNNSELCGKTACQASQITLDDTILSAAGVDNCLNSICGVKSVSSPDIAGIGVIISIFIQLSITLAAPLILVVCHIVQKKTRRHGNDVEEGSTTKPRKPLVPLTSLQEGLLVTLDEFQRAQCCFAIAIDIASLSKFARKRCM